MSVKSKILHISAFLLLTTSVFGAPFPRGCEVQGFAFTGRDLLLNDKGMQTFYLVHNHTPQTIQLQRIVDPTAFMSPPLTARIATDQWAAFASDVQNLPFECVYVHDTGTTVVNCYEVVEICQYPRAKFALSNMGNYWLSVNKEQSAIINDAVKKGIYLRW